MSSSSTGAGSDVVPASTSVATAYLVETTLLEVLTSISFILAVLLTASSMPRFSAGQAVAKTKRFFHCALTICCTLVRGEATGDGQLCVQTRRISRSASELTRAARFLLNTFSCLFIFSFSSRRFSLSSSSSSFSFLPLRMW